MKEGFRRSSNALNHVRGPTSPRSSEENHAIVSQSRYSVEVRCFLPHVRICTGISFACASERSVPVHRGELDASGIVYVVRPIRCSAEHGRRRSFAVQQSCAGAGGFQPRRHDHHRRGSHQCAAARRGYRAAAGADFGRRQHAGHPGNSTMHQRAAGRPDTAAALPASQLPGHHVTADNGADIVWPAIAAADHQHQRHGEYRHG